MTCFVRLPEVMSSTGLKRSTIYRLISLGEFPAAVKLSQRAVGWVKSDIEAWQDARVMQLRRPSDLL